MLSLFPSMLAFEQVAPFLLRMTIGLVFIFWSMDKLRNRTSNKNTAYGVLEFIIGALFIFGIYTQLAALAASIIFVVHLVGKIRAKSFFTDGINYYFILLAISLSLLFLGPGILSIDFPL